ncbi:MAG: aminoglycoside phosphotransferase family protein [Candidatus Paceibacterota bacterium]|jgi:hypothetical protein
MEINKISLKKYFESRFDGRKIDRIEILPLGKGCIGIGSLVEFEIGGTKYRKVLKSLFCEHMGSEYPADRAQSLLLAHHTFNDMDNHVRSFDVVGVSGSGSVLPIGDAQEFFIFMDEAKGTDLFSDIKRIAKNDEYSQNDKEKVLILAKYLAKLHSKKFKSDSLYKRKIRDTIGSGVSIMGVLDMYPENLSWFGPGVQAEIVKKAVEHWMLEKYRSERLCEIHGDFHPGNIWFMDKNDFTLLDRSRGRYGEAADDITAFLINFIFYSLVHRGEFDGALAELFHIFIDEYLRRTQDEEMAGVIAPYWAFRMVVVCNPHPFFYPDSFYEDERTALAVRKKMINFALNALDAKTFEWKKMNSYFG